MRALKRAAVFLLLAGCASFDGRGLVAGQSTRPTSRRSWARPPTSAPRRGGETVYYYPRLPWGYATYAARIAPDGKLVALEQRLTLENIEKLKPGVTRAERGARPPRAAVRADEAGAHRGNEIWTYPMRIAGYPDAEMVPGPHLPGRRGARDVTSSTIRTGPRGCAAGPRLH